LFHIWCGCQGPTPATAESLPTTWALEREPLVSGDVELWPAERQAFVAGQRVTLTQREFEVLHVLVLGVGHVIAKERLHQAVWGSATAPGPRDRSVDVHVSKLRRKLRAVAPRREYIHTHFALGYRFDPEPGPRAG
jgi:DNA-binding response OmpR family regulator